MPEQITLAERTAHSRGHSVPRFLAKQPHLAAGLAASILLILFALVTLALALPAEDDYVHALASGLVSLNDTGSALQRAAFRQPDLLPVYGASETRWGTPPYDALSVFHDYPTGFAPFEVAHTGANALIFAQQLAAIGPELSGKKVVISVTPRSFVAPMIDPDQYAANFSPLHAYELAFSLHLSQGTKRAAAQRMLQYSQTLQDDPLLRYALATLAAPSMPRSAVYYLILPLGKLQILLLNLEDHVRTLQFIFSQNLSPAVERKPAQINWPELKARAERAQMHASNNNPFGFDNGIWSQGLEARVSRKVDATSDAEFLSQLGSSHEWTDLDIALRVLQESRARPLIISRPINGLYWETMGVSAVARSRYYEKLRQVAAAYNVPVVDFADHDTDRYFSTDPASHPSRVGWAYVDEAMDSFYHDTLH